MKKISHKITISVYGARHSNTTKSFNALEQAQKLGGFIASNNCILTIPATTGFSFVLEKVPIIQGGK